MLVLNSACIQKSCSERPPGPHVVAGSRENRILSPFPTDRLTVPDAATRTGLRVDLPLPEEGNELERKLVEHANELDGFGVFAPLCVQFDQPLDLSSVTPDSCYLVRVEDGSRVPLDLGLSYFPTEIAEPVAFFPNEPAYSSLLFSATNRVPFYEDESNTLVLRPTVPLRPGSRYVAILTRRLQGLDGSPIEPPPNEPPTLQEFEDFTRVMQWLGLAPVDVGFYWVFTTQTIADDLEAIRRGLDGQGSLGWLRSQFPPAIAAIKEIENGVLDGKPHTLSPSVANNMFDLVYKVAQIISPIYPDVEKELKLLTELFTEMKNVDYFVFGNFVTPNFLASSSGLFELDAGMRTAQVTGASVPFLLTVPKPTAENHYAQPPYPVVVLGHGLTGSRLMALLMGDRMAAHGLALACPDMVGHGPLEELYTLPHKLKTLDGWMSWLVRVPLVGLMFLSGSVSNPFDSLPQLVDKAMSHGVLEAIFVEGRASDVNGDGLLDPAQAFFDSDFFRMRDNVRQCVVDQMQMVRILRNLGHDQNADGLLGREEGDFDGDGVLDLGGPWVPVTYMGVSLGAILGSILLGVDPAVETAVLNVGGGGFADIIYRTEVLNEPFVKHVIRDVFGLAVAGQPKDGQVFFTFNDAPAESSFWALPASKVLEVELRNLSKKKAEKVFAASGGAFSLTILADVGDSLELAVRSSGGIVHAFQMQAPEDGLGLPRGSRKAREMFMLLEWFLEPADPVCYAPLWWQSPLGGAPGKRILVQLSCGDPVVPISAGVALARSAGLISEGRMRKLVELGVLAGENLSVDSLLPVESTAWRAVRFHTGGAHGYVLANTKSDEPLEKKDYAFSAQDQMATFCKTGGLLIEESPALKKVIPYDP